MSFLVRLEDSNESDEDRAFRGHSNGHDLCGGSSTGKRSRVVGHRAQPFDASPFSWTHSYELAQIRNHSLISQLVFSENNLLITSQT